MTESYNRPFPIQGHTEGRHRIPESSIPWWLAEVAYINYSAKYGTRQSLQRLAERGGFGRGELLELLQKTEADDD